MFEDIPEQAELFPYLYSPEYYLYKIMKIYKHSGVCGFHYYSTQDLDDEDFNEIVRMIFSKLHLQFAMTIVEEHPKMSQDDAIQLAFTYMLNYVQQFYCELTLRYEKKYHIRNPTIYEDQKNLLKKYGEEPNVQ